MTASAKLHSTLAAFTLIETIAVVILLGILSAIILPIFMQPSSFNARTTRDEIIASLRYAQQLAAADSARTVRFISTANSFSITVDNVVIALPEGGGNYPRPLDNNLTLSPATTLVFSSLGDTNATMFSLNTLEKICVAATGYAYAC